MLIAEKFLKKNLSFIDFPIPYEEGICGYELKEQNVKTINFVSYNKVSYKNNFVKYNFKFQKLVCNFSDKKNVMTSNIVEADYNEFYIFFHEIMEKSNSAESVYIMQSYDEIEIYYWKAFVITNDSWFANNMSILPDSFLKTIDQSITVEKRRKYLNEFLDFLNDKYFNILYSWEVFYPREQKKTFLDWFPMMMGAPCLTVV